MKKGKKSGSSVVDAVRWILLTLVVSFCVLVTVRSLALESQKKELGIQAVELMYQFTEVQQIQLNMIKLKAITTEAVFNQLTVDNEDRALYTYVQFAGDATSVNIIKATSSYVLYSVNNVNIDEQRRFIFMFECDGSGKISYVREAEINDFVTFAD